MPIGRRRFTVSSLALVLASALSGCSTADTTPVDIDGLPGVWTGRGGGRVEFHADGRFSMKGIPTESIGFAFSEPPDEDRVAGSGTWERVPDEDQVQLMIDAGGSFADAAQVAVLMVAEDGPPQVLFFSTNVDKPYGYEIRRNS
ncbi:hypothetical protein ACFXOL_29320 [Streptomyces californicus]|uniref:hypothetical protein n=1 Tax=Streptomyces TaxID=1883 RepID=UPI00211B4840|nr:MULTISPECIES: hypothetical protein [Streptomyces]MDW4897309.1 hypothetical protein [Streptomyces californicus]